MTFFYNFKLIINSNIMFEHDTEVYFLQSQTWCPAALIYSIWRHSFLRATPKRAAPQPVLYSTVCTDIFWCGSQSLTTVCPDENNNCRCPQLCGNSS